MLGAKIPVCSLEGIVVKMEFIMHYSMPKTAYLGQERSYLSIESEYAILKSWHTVAPHQHESHRRLMNTQTVHTTLVLSSI